MNTMKKMSRSNVKARRWLESNGFRDIQLFPHTRFFKDISLNSLKFDGIAKSNSKICLFQVKSNRRPTKVYLKQMQEFVQKYGIICIWFNVRDRKDIEVLGISVP